MKTEASALVWSGRRWGSETRGWRGNLCEERRGPAMGELHGGRDPLPCAGRETGPPMGRSVKDRA